MSSEADAPLASHVAAKAPLAGRVATRPVLPPLMVASTLALVVLGVGLTVVAGPLFDVSADSAMQLLERQPYVRAVFPDGAP